MAWRRSRDTGERFIIEFRLATATGDAQWIQVSTEPVVTNGELTGFVGTAIDCTTVVEQRRLSDQLVGLIDASGDAVVVFDRAGYLQFANESAQSLIGITETSHAISDTAARSFMQAVRDQLPREVLEHHDPTRPVNQWNGEIAFRSPDGIERTFHVVVQVVRHRDGTLHHWSVNARDVTDERSAQQELMRLATHDALTQLPNRVMFLRKTAEALERSRTTASAVAVLFIDLDRLKHVNDTIGHAVGDQYIISTARKLVAATRPSDLVARLGGDEFVVLCEGLLDEHVAMDVAERVRTAITGPVIVQGVEIESGASIGVALADDELLRTHSSQDAAVTLLRRADTAMYRAKQRGRGRSEMYSDDMHRAASERLTLASHLERALAGEQFFVLYQPIVSAQSGRVAGFEALLRWNHPERGELAPVSFIELADESGLIGPIGDWVLHTACSSLRSWIDAGIVERSCAIHLNVSRRQLADATFVDRVTTILRDHDIDGSQLVIETSESSLLDNNPSTLRSISALARNGIRIAIDDFGAGSGSITSLRNFPADQLKLDGTLVRDVGRPEGGDDPVVRSLIQLAHSFDLTVVAEWVTTDDQAQRLRVLGCDLLQGHNISKPLTANEVTERYSSTGLGPVPAK